MDQKEAAAVELRAMRSAWRALETSWELVPAERCALMPAGGHDEEAPPHDTEARMRMLLEIGYRIRVPEGDLPDWLREPSPTLRWLTPLDVMSGSRADLRAFRDLLDRGFGS